MCCRLVVGFCCSFFGRAFAFFDCVRNVELTRRNRRTTVVVVMTRYASFMGVYVCVCRCLRHIGDPALCPLST